MVTTGAWQIWLPPMLTVLGTLIVVLFGVLYSNRLMDAKVDALRAEVRQGFAELRLEFRTALSELSQRIERLEEEKGRVLRP